MARWLLGGAAARRRCPAADRPSGTGRAAHLAGRGMRRLPRPRRHRPQRRCPHLAAQNELYLYNQLLAFRSGRRPHKEMRYMARSISLAEAQATS